MEVGRARYKQMTMAVREEISRGLACGLRRAGMTEC